MINEGADLTEYSEPNSDELLFIFQYDLSPVPKHFAMWISACRIKKSVF